MGGEYAGAGTRACEGTAPALLPTRPRPHGEPQGPKNAEPGRQGHVPTAYAGRVVMSTGAPHPMDRGEAALAALAQTITASLEVDTILQRVTDGARELCHSDGAAIALREPGTEAAVIRYWAGRPYRGFLGAWIAPGEGIGGLVLATGRPCRTDDYEHDPRISP